MGGHGGGDTPTPPQPSTENQPAFSSTTTGNQPAFSSTTTMTGGGTAMMASFQAGMMAGYQAGMMMANFQQQRQLMSNHPPTNNIMGTFGGGVPPAIMAQQLFHAQIQQQQQRQQSSSSSVVNHLRKQQNKQPFQQKRDANQQQHPALAVPPSMKKKRKKGTSSSSPPPLHIYSWDIPYKRWHSKASSACFGGSDNNTPEFVAIDELKVTTTLQLPLVRHCLKRNGSKRQTVYNKHDQFVGYEYKIDIDDEDMLTTKKIDELICNCAVYCMLRNDQRLKLDYYRKEYLILVCQGCGMRYMFVSFKTFTIFLYDTCKCCNGSKCYQVTTSTSRNGDDRLIMINKYFNFDLAHSFILLRQILHFPESFTDESKLILLIDDLKTTFRFNIRPKDWMKRWYNRWKNASSLSNPLSIGPNATIYEVFSAYKKKQQEHTTTKPKEACGNTTINSITTSNDVNAAAADAATVAATETAAVPAASTPAGATAASKQAPAAEATVTVAPSGSTVPQKAFATV